MYLILPSSTNFLSSPIYAYIHTKVQRMQRLAEFQKTQVLISATCQRKNGVIA
jgi:hypothetical protein